MAVEGENLGTATIYVTVDTTTAEAGVARTKVALAGMSAEAEKQYTAMTAGQRKVADGQLKQIALIGKTQAERAALNAQMKVGGQLGAEMAQAALAQQQALNAVQEKAALSSAKWSDAQLLKANQSLAAYTAQLDAAKAASTAQAEMAAADDARFKQIATDAMAEAEARQAITAATMEQARANIALMESSGVGAARGATAAVGALDSRVVKQQIDDMAALDAVEGKKVVTTEEAIAADLALDRLQAAGMISNEQLSETFAALDVATAAETKSLHANSTAQVENAGATAVNSRTQYELGIMLGEVASGNVNRLKRSAAALANSTGLLRAIMSPVGLAISGVVAAMAALGVATEKGEAEFSKFNTALAATGGYAGITYTQYRALAESLAGSGTSIGKAKEALDALASSGKFSGDQLGQAAQAALDMAQLTGQSVDQAITAISRLAEDPVKAIESLDEQYHFLSTATLQHIQELEEQGNKQDAANLAEQTYAEALRGRAADMEKNLGTLQSVWRSLGESASWAWDQMQGLGRPTTKLDDLGAQYDKLLKFRMSVADRLNGNSTLGDFVNIPDAIGGKSTAGMSLQDQLTAIDAQLAKIRGDTKPLQDAANAAANAKSDAAQLQLAGNQGVETLTKLGINLDGIKSKQDKVAEAATALFNVWRAGGQLPKGVSFTGPIADVPVGAGWDAIKKQLLKGSPESEAAKQAATALASFQSQVAGLDTRSANVPTDPELTKYAQGVAKLTDEFDKAVSKGADVTRATALFDQGVAALNRTLDASREKLQGEEKAAIDGYKASLDKSNDALQRSVDNEIAKISMGDKEYQLQMKLNEAYQQEAEALQKLEQQRETNTGTRGAAYADAVYKQDVANLKAATAQKVQIIKDGYVRMDAAQADWVNGAIAAMQNWADAGMNVADQTKTLFTNAFSGMNDALVNFVQTGKLSFSKLADSIIADLVRMELRVLESNILKSLLGAFMTGPAGANMGFFGQYSQSATDSTAGSIVSSIYGNANGGVYNSASLSRYSGGVYDSPHFFKFANGGVFGEAGPEAIMPLSRGRDGKLGVKAASAGSGPLELHINLKNESGQALQAKQQGQASQNGNRIMADFVLSTVAGDVAGGGKTAKAFQQRFGLARAGIPVGA